MDILRETTKYSYIRRISIFCHTQALSQSGNKNYIEVNPCKPNEPVCKIQENEQPFFYIYGVVISKIGLRFLLSVLEKEVLTLINIAPIQLHSNSWAFRMAFQILCAYFGINLSGNVFFYFFFEDKKMLIKEEDVHLT